MSCDNNDDDKNNGSETQTGCSATYDEKEETHNAFGEDECWVKNTRFNTAKGLSWQQRQKWESRG